MKKPLQFFFLFNKGQRKGIVALLFLIIIFQAGYFVFTSFSFLGNNEVSAEEAEWLSHQEQIDKLKETQVANRDTVFPFNPNFISEYKGYVLGLSAEQLQRLDAYRGTGAFIHSPEEFKKITGIQDTLLIKLKPYFRFPEKFTEGVKAKVVLNHREQVSQSVIKVIDLNKATQEDLVKIYGIGPYYSKLIIDKRELLGAYVSIDQLDDFKEIPTEVLSTVKEKFAIFSESKVKTINVNTASLNQLSRFPYFNKDIARAIITERSMLGNFTKIEDLLKINGFPVEKEKIIALYLKF